MDENTKAAIASAVRDKGNREALAQMFVEYLEPGHITVDFASMLLDSRSLKEGDSLVKKLSKGIKVYTLVPDSIHLKSEITVYERANYILDGLDVGVTYNEWEMNAGDLGTVEEIRGEMLAKLKDSFQQKIFTALSSIWTAVNTPNNYIDAGGPITSTILKNAIDYINLTTSSAKAVVGTRAALTPITQFGGFWNDGNTVGTDAMWRGLDPQLQEIMQTGWLGRWYGVPIVAINQIYDNFEDYNAFIPEDKVLVIGDKVGEFITYGDVNYKEYTDPRPTPPQWFLEFYQRFGIMIWKADGIYVIGGIS
ncbi:MAG: HK97-fold major capsid protein [Candidatus Thorarchaeota archaeon]|jgi:hypothetical protein